MNIMKKRPFVILLLLSLLIPATAQIAPVVPASTSIANTSVANQDEWSAFQNVASLAHIGKMEFSAQYENKFMLKELSIRSAQAGFSTKFANIGASFSYHGYSVYNEMLIGLGIARNFGDKFSMGVQFDYYNAYFTTPEENRYRGAVLAQLGVSSRLMDNLTIGFHTFNPFQTNIETDYSTKRLPSIFSIGANYEFAKNVKWLTQIDKEVSSNFRFATGFEYTMIEALTVKLGAYAYENIVPCLGVGVHLGKFDFNLNAELDPYLKLNTLANLKYRF